MKIGCKKFYRKIDGTYAYDEPDIHKKHRRLLKKYHTKLLRKRLIKYIRYKED